eukprot:scaffold10297_cov113-Isochrysis_galbana.AAC.8
MRKGGKGPRIAVSGVGLSAASAVRAEGAGRCRDDTGLDAAGKQVAGCCTPRRWRDVAQRCSWPGKGPAHHQRCPPRRSRPPA